MLNDKLKNAPMMSKGNWYEDFNEGRVFKHHWGRTLFNSDNIYYSRITLNSCPLYFNRPYASMRGHRDLVINPYLVFLTVFGLSVEDLSENGIAFLGVEGLEFLADVYDGDTVLAESVVIARRRSKSYDKAGICTWETRGYTADGRSIVRFKRTNLIRSRG